MSVCPHGTTWLSLDGFSWNLTFECFSKNVEKIQVSLKSDQNNGYFKWRPMYIYDSILLNLSGNKKFFGKSCRENQNTFYVYSFCFEKMPFVGQCGKIW